MEWNEVERKKRKKKMLKKKRKLKDQVTLRNGAGMLGVGPIANETLEHFGNITKNSEEVRKVAVKEFLVHHLCFTEEELEGTEIKETKRAITDDIVYFAVEEHYFIKEISYRKADSRNDKIVVRNYIPPQLHVRYMAMNRECTARRRTDKTLKTQIQLGKIDLELFVKEKGKNEAFKKINLEEFVDVKKPPKFDHSISWIFLLLYNLWSYRVKNKSIILIQWENKFQKSVVWIYIWIVFFLFLEAKVETIDWN